jgi:hypothetical protein
MGYNAFARIAKLVALLGFLLPWVVVSCSNTVIATATGVQLMTGDLQPAGPLAGQSMDHKPDPDMVVIAAAAVIALGLAVTVFARARAASAILLAASLIAIGLCFFSIENLRAGLNKQAHSHRYEQAVGSEEVGQSIANLVQVETREGFWVSVGALGLAAMLALGGLAQIRVSMGALSEPKRDPVEPPH